MTGSTGGSRAAISASVTIWSTSAAICASPSGVSASPRKSSVVTLVSPASPKSSSISCRVAATALSRGSVSSVVGSGARSEAPAPSATVVTRRAAMVSHGRTVTSQLTRVSTWIMTRAILRTACTERLAPCVAPPPWAVAPAVYRPARRWVERAYTDLNPDPYMMLP